MNDFYRGYMQGFKDACLQKQSDSVEQSAEHVGEPVSGFKLSEIGHRFDGVVQHHVPFVVVEFEPVPVNSKYQAKGWVDRDTFIANIETTATQQRKPLTDEQLKPHIQIAMKYYGYDETKYGPTTTSGFVWLARAIEAAHGINKE
jgi:hypothetical protein